MNLELKYIHDGTFSYDKYSFFEIIIRLSCSVDLIIRLSWYLYIRFHHEEDKKNKLKYLNCVKLNKNLFCVAIQAP